MERRLTLIFGKKALPAQVHHVLDENGKIRDNSNHKGLLSVGCRGRRLELYKAHQIRKITLGGTGCNLQSIRRNNGFPMSWGLYNVAVQRFQWMLPNDIMQISFAERMEKWSLQANFEAARHCQNFGSYSWIKAEMVFYKGGKVGRWRSKSYMKANGSHYPGRLATMKQ